MTMDATAGGGSSRRDFLRRGALATGAVWAAPTLINVGPRAFAGATASPPGFERTCLGGGGILYRARWEADANEDTSLFDEEESDGVFIDADEPLGNGACDPPTEWEDDSVLSLSQLLGDDETEYRYVMAGDSATGLTATINDDETVTFTLPEGCLLLAYAGKGGSAGDGDEACSDFRDDEYTEELNSFTVPLPENGNGVSNVSFVFCCDEPAPVDP